MVFIKGLRYTRFQGVAAVVACGRGVVHDVVERAWGSCDRKRAGGVSLSLLNLLTSLLEHCIFQLLTL